MTGSLVRARLFLVGGAVLIFLGGLLVAMARWNAAETDRAFVEAAALAARSPPAPGGVRYWAPVANDLPQVTARVRIEAAERLRQVPTLPAMPPIQVPGLAPRTVPQPSDKPAAAPR